MKKLKLYQIMEDDNSSLKLKEKINLKETMDI